jgi:hypothetical protein
MTRLMNTRAFRLLSLEIAVETYSARPADRWFDMWTEGRSRLAWIGRRLVILN